MARNKSLMMIGTLAIAAALALPGCSATNYKQVQWQNNGQPTVYNARQDRQEYTFVYHPSIQAYYEPYTATYFSFDGHGWNQSASRPRTFITDPTDARIVTLATNRPFESHYSVAASHGPWIGRFPQADELAPKVERIVVGDNRSGEKRYNHTFDSKGNLIREEIYYVDPFEVTTVDDIND